MTSKFLFQVLNATGKVEDLYNHVELDRESRKYVHFRVQHKTMSYNAWGKETSHTHYYPLEKCGQDHFVTNYEKEFIASKPPKQNLFYCIKAPEVFL